VVAYRFPLHIRRKTKIYMSSVPFYLLAVLVPPPLAATAAGAGALLGELSMRSQRGTLAGDVASEVGRRVLVVLLGALVAHRPRGEQAARVRDEFLTATSHDLRTPLTVMLLHVEVLRTELEKGGPVSVEWLCTHLTSIATAGSRMVANLQEITDTARLQMGEQ